HLVAVLGTGDRVVEVGEHHVQRAVRRGERLGELVLVAGTVRRRYAEGVVAHGTGGADERRGTERLAVVGGVCREDVGGTVGRERRPGHVDPVLERAAAVVVHRHQLPVQQEATGSGDVVVLHDRAPGEVPRGARVAGGAVHVEGARLVRVRRRGGAPVQLLAGQLRVA